VRAVGRSNNQRSASDNRNTITPDGARNMPANGKHTLQMRSRYNNATVQSAN
jgi:hypothetical protein